MRQAATGGVARAGILAVATCLLLPGLGRAQSSSVTSQDQSAGPDNATSQDAASAGCFTVVMPPAGGAPHAPLLLDQCTGASWLLVRDPVAPSQPGGGSQFRYRWFPLAIASAEAVMADAPVSETAPAARSAVVIPPAANRGSNPGASPAAATVAREDKHRPVKEN